MSQTQTNESHHFPLVLLCDALFLKKPFPRISLPLTFLDVPRLPDCLWPRPLLRLTSLLSSHFRCFSLVFENGPFLPPGPLLLSSSRRWENCGREADRKHMTMVVKACFVQSAVTCHSPPLLTHTQHWDQRLPPCRGRQN